MFNWKTLIWRPNTQVGTLLERHARHDYYYNALFRSPDRVLHLGAEPLRAGPEPEQAGGGEVGLGERGGATELHEAAARDGEKDQEQREAHGNEEIQWLSEKAGNIR